MKPILLFTTIALLTAATAPLGFAKDKKKDKKDKDRERTVYVERNGGVRYYLDSHGKRQWITDDRDDRDWDNRNHGYGYNRDRTRTVYVIERNRPVQRVVYVDPSGGYYSWVNGRRLYLRGRVYTSYPSDYYYRDGRPRVSITIPLSP